MLTFHSLKLGSRTPAAEDAVCLTFELPEALRTQYAFEPGQHLVVRANVGGRTLRRTYSIVSPKHGELRIGVRAQGEMSRYLTEGLALGEALDVMTPNGSFHPTLEPARAKRYVAIAAGSGVTPILSIVSSVLEHEPGSQVVLLYANRDSARAMFVEELLALKNRFMSRLAVHFIMSREPQDADAFNGRLDRQKLRNLAARLFDVRRIDDFFLCGPGSMLDDLSAELKELGATGKIHIERFGAAPRAGVADAGVVPAREEPPSTPSVAAGTVSVSVQMDGRQRHFKMARDETVLDAAGRAGLDLPFACRAGVCSTCRARVVRGSVEMAYNQALEEWEVAAGFVLCCQSRPTSSELAITYDQR
jgi:ring-1,2-phenylacetyl-CoA epoxidase subunit PaaE